MVIFSIYDFYRVGLRLPVIISIQKITLRACSFPLQYLTLR